MSSRNRYLEPEERRQATCLFRALTRAQELFAAGETRSAKFVDEMTAVVAAQPAVRVEYAQVIHPRELTPVAAVEKGAVATVAAIVNETRLIDNTILGKENLRAEVSTC
jgi:pantothenate synthetase